MTNATTTIEPAADAAEVASRKPQQRGDTRSRLLSAAQELFVSKGFHATRPQDISRAAGVGHGTFYLHFKDKQACFLAFADAAAEALETFVEQNADADLMPYEAIRETIRLTYEFSQSNPGLLAAALTDMSVINGGEGGSILMGRWGVQWGERLAEWQRDGQVAAHVDAGFIGYAFPGIIRQAGEYAAGKEAVDSETLDALMAFLAAGLGLTRSEETH